ncbi:MAG: sigma-70 family RNA polymerase sigma factor [Prevotella sp.]|uniref:RNA polymerase sigma factor n=1 Tax=Prevotella sp. TaxID=59823 RepID=UPI002A2F1E57|nr:sigma-70 family RNA polymerase sigma factor [Prevotella sp.]MDD7318594.1 sigma-70 family RNA polymerase sigma factor [Prevotellaceae bacterium]MDY4020395.1 sigma-70 family RNA polymerase sigma factor [Prevotella sp.]
MTASDFKCLFLPCHKQMYWVAMRLTANTVEAEDLVQEAFMRLWLKRNELHDVVSPLSFGIRTMRNIFLDRLRKRHIRESDRDLAEVTITENATAESSLIATETLQSILLLIEKLPEQQRRIITMKDLEGMTYEQIAQQTGLSEAGVRTSLSRARQALRQQFKANNHDETI